MVELWALTTGAVIVYVRDWIAVAVVAGLFLRLVGAFAGDQVINRLDRIADALDNVVVIRRNQ